MTRLVDTAIWFAVGLVATILLTCIVLAGAVLVAS